MLDTERLDRAFWQAAAARRGLAFSDELHATLVGRRAKDSELAVRAHFGEEFPYQELRSEIRLQWLAAAKAGLPRKQGLIEVLEALDRAQIARAVATSTARESALLSLGELALRFHAIACGDEVTHGKPAPDIFLLAAERLGADPADCVALEDSPAGLAAARAAGMSAVWIPDLVVPPDEPDYECASLHEIATWISLF